MTDHAITTFKNATHCPNCKQAMQHHGLAGHYGRNVAIDSCANCHVFWFDRSESTSLNADGVVELFKLINTYKIAQTAGFNRQLGCPRCHLKLHAKNDRVNTGSFTYFACDDGHGRLTTFYQFLIEKKFVRLLNSLEIAQLGADVKQIQCSGCGAPVKLSEQSACSYCRAPIAVFDRNAAQKAIDQYLKKRPVQLPTNINTSYSFRDKQEAEPSLGFDLVSAGLAILMKSLVD
jgi:Zn-finger nucleic acid-binding protein